MNTSEIYGFILPEKTDYYDIDEFNFNFMLTELTLKSHERYKANLDSDGKIVISELPDDSPTSEKVAAALELTGDEPRVNAALLKLLELLGGKAGESHEHTAGDITSGILPVTRGGSGQSSAAKALYAFINGAGALAAAGPATGDYVGLVDVSASTGKKVTLGNLVSFLNTSLGVARITAGSYAGTGVYGEDDPNTLSFSFIPKLVIVGVYGLLPSSGGDHWDSSFIWQAGQTVSWANNGRLNFTQSGQTLSWYHPEISGVSSDAQYQLNASGTTYYYVAIG